MRLFLLFMFVAVAVASRITVGNHALDNAWTQFKTKYNKKYDLSEEASRRIVWESNSAFIEKHNQEAAQGKHKFTMAVNKFADMTNEEFSQSMYQYKPSSATKSGVQIKDDGDFQDVLPDNIDWRDRNLVSYVRDYEWCDTSWIVSALGSLEGQHAKSTGNLVSLSAQQVTDCDSVGDDCEGGNMMESTFEYILNSDGVQDEDTYRSDNIGYPGTCKFDSRQIVASMKGYAQLKSGSERELQRATAAIGPISVAIDGKGGFRYYYGGLYDETDCSSTDVNHGLLVVGYGTTDDGTDYWIVKNMWGMDWGEKGYARIVRNGNNTCGIATRASYPIVF